MAGAPCVEHVIVLMLENRSFDNFLGWSYGLTGEECNLDAGGSPSRVVKVSKGAPFDDPRVDPDHDYEFVIPQLDTPSPNAPTNGGFVNSYRKKLEKKQADPSAAWTIMRCFDPSDLPVLTRLASEFCVCTRWHSSMPGPTWPNRFFVHSAQSGGMVSNRPIAVKSIFDSLCEARLRSRIYFHDIPQAFGNTTILELFLQKNQYFSVRRFRDFARDVARGDLAAYTFIEPQYFEIGDFDKGWERWLYRILAKLGLAGGKKANDQHPPHDVRMGEKLIRDVYSAIATSKREYWRNTMLVVIYDEHGGLYDSKQTTHSPDPVPGGPHETDFSFTRYGIRVPAVVVSPYVVNDPADATLYDHASVCRTVQRCFGLPAALTARDAGANYIMGAFPTGRARGRWPKLASPRVFPFTRDRQRTLSDLQETLRDLAATIAGHETVQAIRPTIAAEPVPTTDSEPEARRYVQQVMKTMIE